MNKRSEIINAVDYLAIDNVEHCFADHAGLLLKDNIIQNGHKDVAKY